MIQIANVGRPNSLRNTVVVTVFKAADNTYNWSLVLKRFSSEVDRLATMKLRYGLHHCQWTNSTITRYQDEINKKYNFNNDE